MTGMRLDGIMLMQLSINCHTRLEPQALAVSREAEFVTCSRSENWLATTSPHKCS